MTEPSRCAFFTFVSVRSRLKVAGIPGEAASFVTLPETSQSTPSAPPISAMQPASAQPSICRCFSNASMFRMASAVTVWNAPIRSSSFAATPPAALASSFDAPFAVKSRTAIFGFACADAQSGSAATSAANRARARMPSMIGTPGAEVASPWLRAPPRLRQSGGDEAGARRVGARHRRPRPGRGGGDRAVRRRDPRRVRAAAPRRRARAPAAR